MHKVESNPGPAVQPETRQTAVERPPATMSAVQQSAALIPSGAGMGAHTSGSAAAQASELLQFAGAGAQGRDVHSVAALGVAGAAQALPFAEQIQTSFGAHDISSVQAYTDSSAERACLEMGAKAYATGDKVAFGSTPTLHTAAHEAAHTVQQKAGVSLKGGVGQSGDAYERHADAVADLVVQGKSAEAMLGPVTAGSQSAAVQREDENNSGDTSGQAQGSLSPEAREKLINRTRDLIPLAGVAYMKACRDYEKKLAGAAKKKTDAATLALDIALCFVPPSFSAAAKNALMGVSANLTGPALDAAVKAAENSVRGGLLRANANVWTANLKKGLESVVSSDPSKYVSTIERLAPAAFQKAVKNINDRTSDADLIANAGYWASESVVVPDHWEKAIRQEVMKFQMVVDSINWPGMDFSPGGPPGHAVYIVDEKGKPAKGHNGATMMVVDFLKGDDTNVMLYINPGLEGAAIAQHTAEYGAPPSQKYIADHGRARRYAP